MITEIIVAIIGASVGIIGAFLAIYGQIRTKKLEHELALQRESQSRESKINALIAKYRNPLLKASQNLQSRIFNIVQQGFLQVYYHKSQTDKEYSIQHTLYVIAEYFGWVEVLRREVQFLDFGDLETSRKLEDLLDNISQAFLTDNLELTFLLFRGQQQAIGEVMLIKSPIDPGKYECMGYSEFVRRFDEVDFQRWFVKLIKDIELLANEPIAHEQRLIVLQHSLIDLIDFLDPEYARIPQNKRKKTNFNRNVS